MTSGSEGMRWGERGGAKSWRRERGFHLAKSEMSAILNSVKGRQEIASTFSPDRSLSAHIEDPGTGFSRFSARDFQKGITDVFVVLAGKEGSVLTADVLRGQLQDH